MGTIVANQGFTIPVKRYYLLAAVAVTRGDVMAIDPTAVNATTGLAESIRVPTADDVLNGVAAIAEKDIAVNRRGWFVTSGSSVVANLAAGVASGEALIMTATARTFADGSGSTAAKIFGKAKAAGAGLGSVDVEGIGGFAGTRAVT